MARHSSAPSSNIYTILAFIAFVSLVAAIIYVWMRLSALGVSPFSYPT